MVTVYHRVEIIDIQFEKRVHKSNHRVILAGVENAPGLKYRRGEGSNIFGIEQNHSQVTL